MVLLIGLILPCQAMAIHVSPEKVLISATYNGEDVFVTGEVENDEEAVVQVIGNSSQAEFKQTGKVGGFLWMTVGHLSISHAPSAYLLYLPEKISEMRNSSKSLWQELGIGFESLLPGIVIEPEVENKAEVFADFLKLKTHDKLYQMADNAVEYSEAPDGEKEFKAKLHIPPKMPVAQYKVRVLRVRDGKVVGQEEGEIHMKEVGFPALISTLAFNRSLLYGILAVGIAIFAGLFMGVLFKDRGGAH